MALLRQRSRAAAPVWEEEAGSHLDAGLRALNQAASAGQQQQFRIYGELLGKWNATYNLLGATTSQAIVQDHLLDSIAVHPAVVKWLPPRQLLVDVGSGAGLPGIVLAIMEPERPFLLVEPVGKKAAFLRQVAAGCRLANVRVLEERIEDTNLLPEDPLRHDVQAPRTPRQAPGPHFICRAFTSLARFVSLCQSHASGHSLFLAMKAARVADELKNLEPGVEVLAVEALRTAAKDVRRNLVVMRRRRAQPAFAAPA